MNEKLNIQNLIELLAEKHGMDKADAESFVKEFFQLIEESLENDKYVKIRGLGTFKLIDVESRESVNINTGERFEIQGHTKVSFAPEKHGMDGYYYFSRKCIEDGINNALQIIRNMERENQYVSEVRSLLESTTCGVIYTDSNMTITYVNKTAFDILHCYRDSVLQKPLTDILPSKIIERLQRSGGQESNIQLTIFDTDVIGNIFPLKIGSSFPRICFMFEKASSILESEAMIRQESKRKNFSTRYSFEDIIGTSPAIRKAIDTAKRFAMRNSTVLINAETGSGKELFAQSIHGYSQRRHYPFVAINCASIPDTLIESELFGYEEGAFTGAKKGGRIGKFMLANTGTLFLDEIGDMPLYLQAKLLRVLSDRQVDRIGSSKLVDVDVHIIAATNKNLEEMIGKKEFREDLYYRLNVIPFYIPPLRERCEDILPLIEHFIEKYNCKLGKHIRGISPQTLARLEKYGWPGNVRELENGIEYMVNFEMEDLLSEKNLPQRLRGEGENAPVGAAPAG